MPAAYEPPQQRPALFTDRRRAHHANEHVLAYVYFEEEPGRHLLTRDEERRIAAAGITALPNYVMAASCPRSRDERTC